MSDKKTCTMIDNEGNLLQQEFIFSELIKGYIPPAHFEFEDYYEPPKYIIEQDFYE